MLHQFIFWLFRKKAVPLQRISKQNIVYVQRLKMFEK